MIEDMNASSFYTIPIIEKILVEKVPDIWGTKGKGKINEAKDVERPNKKKNKRKMKDDIKVSKEDNVKYTQDHQTRVHEMAAGASSSIVVDRIVVATTEFNRINA